MKSISELSDLRGRVALVAGGAGRIGRAIGEALAEAGAEIGLLDLPSEQLEEARVGLGDRFTQKVISLPCDLSQESEIGATAELIKREFGQLDILVHCAALCGASELKGWTVPFEDQSVHTWRRALEVNLTSAFTMTQTCSPFLRESGCGSVILMGSIYGMLGPDMRLYDGCEGMGNPAAYAAAKGGIVQLCRWLSTNLAPDVRVNCIAPGGIARNQAKAFVERYESRVPLGRMGREEDIKGAALFLASDLSAYVTGQNLAVDGGWSAW